MTSRDPASADPAQAASARRYPVRPIVGVGAVVLVPREGNGPSTPPRIVLIRRRFEPLAGQWSLPGGTVELGETLQEGLARELREETGLEVDIGPVVEVFDRITRDPDGRVRFHYVLIDFVCRAAGGRLDAGSDVSDAELAEPGDLARYALTSKTTEVIERAMAMGWR